MKTGLIVFILSTYEAQAYDQSLASCRAFAGLFTSTCNSVTTPMPNDFVTS